MAAMPRVKPSTTGQGMNATARPSPLTPRIMTIRPGHERDQGNAADAVGRDHRGEHHHHGAGRAGDLDVGSAHDGGHQAGHHGGDESGLGADPGTHPEGQGQGERHDAHGDAGQQIRLPGGAETVVVAAGR